MIIETLAAIAGGAEQFGDVTNVLREQTGMQVTSSGVALVLGGLGAMLTTAVAFSFLLRDRDRHGAAFRQCCRTFGLSRRHRRALIDAAATLDAPSPAALLVSQGCFETALRRLAPSRADRATLDEVARRVFDASGPGAKASPDPAT